MRISDWSSDVCSSDLLGNIVGDAKHLVTAKLGHRLLVGGRIIDMSSADRLFDAADAVQQTGRAGLHPRAGELLIAAIRFEAAFLRFCQARDEIASAHA